MKRVGPLLIILCLLAAGCKTTHRQLSASVEWTTAEVPFKLDVPMAIKPSGKAWMVRDSSIYMSVRVFGMEVMAFYANNDSAFLYDKTKNTLVCGKLGADPTTGLKLNANSLQNLLLGIDLHQPQINLSMHSMSFILTPGSVADHKYIESWNARMIEHQKQLTADATLRWNLDQAKWNVDNVPAWKKPSKPKQILGIDDFYLLLTQQF